MPRLSASRGLDPELRPRPVSRPAPRVPRGKAKGAAMPDRLTARALFLRRMRRSVRPGIWLLAGGFALVAGSELFRAIPAIGPVKSPAGSLQHGFGEAAALVGFRISTVVVNGADTTPEAAIRQALGVAPGDPILGFSLSHAASRIEQLGPIQSAVVERALPGQVIVSVTERAPYAIWQTAAKGRGSLPKFVVIDKNGNVIADQDAVAAKRRNPALLLLAGQDAPQHALGLMNELAADPQVRSRVAAAERVDGLRWNLVLRNDTVVKLPEAGESQAIAELGQMQASMALLDRPVEVIDLRQPGRMAIRPYPPIGAAGTADAKPPAGHPKEVKR